MKKIFLSALILMVNFIVFSQDIAFLDKQDIRRSDENLNKEILTTNNDEEWPKCTKPQNLNRVALPNGVIRFKWDEDFNDGSNYQIRYKKKDSYEWVYDEQSKNYFDLPKGVFSDDISFEVRRVCEINGQLDKSLWVWIGSEDLNLLSANCTCDCDETNQILDDKSENVDYYAVYQINADCVYLEWNFPCPYNPDGELTIMLFFGNENYNILFDGFNNSGDSTYALNGSELTKVVYEYRKSSECSSNCEYQAPIYHDYFGEYAESCSTQCTISNFCEYIASRLDSTSNDYHALHSHQEGEDCVFFDWDFPENETCESWTYPFASVEIVLKSGQTTVWSKEYSQNIGTDTYELVGGEQFDEVIYNYKYDNGDGAYISCSYYTDLTFGDFNIDVPECGETTMSPCSVINYLSAERNNNEITLSFKDITQDEFDALFTGVGSPYSIYLDLFDGENSGNNNNLLNNYNINLWEVNDISTWTYTIDLSSYESDDFHLYGGVYANAENGDGFDCEDYYKEINITSLPNLYCNILSLMKGQFLDNTLMMSYVSENYLSGELANLDLTIDEAQAIMTGMDYVNIELNYTYKDDTGNNVSGNATKYVEGSNFQDMVAWSTIFDNIPQNGFEGTLVFTITDSDFSEDDIVCESNILNIYQPQSTTVCQLIGNVRAEVQNTDLKFNMIAVNQNDYNEVADDYEELNIDVDINYLNANNEVILLKHELIPLPKSTNKGGGPINLWNYTIHNLETSDGIAAQNLNLKIEGKIIAIDSDNQQEDCSDFEMDIQVETNPGVSLPPFSCGDEYTYTSPNNQEILNELNVNDIVYSYGFPIMITKLTETGEGKHSGEGLAPMPFKQTRLMVSFSNITVNTTNEVLSGDFYGIKDNIGNYPSIEPDTISIGGKICQPPPPPSGYDQDGYNEVTGLDAYGFDKNGINHKTGTKWDENGFDKDGNFVNGGNHTPDGCTRDSVNYKTGERCDPGAWKNSDASTFVNSVQNTIAVDIDKALNNLKTLYQDSLNIKKPECDALRHDMRELIDQNHLNYDSTYIFGENSEYIKSGMSKHFKGKPKSLDVNFGSEISRNQQTIELENKHVALYGCDIKEIGFTDLIQAINGLTANDKEEIKTTILQKISFLDNAKIQEFNNNPDSFNNWLTEQLKIILKNYIPGITYNGLIPKKYRRNKSFKHNNVDYYNSLASIDNNFAISGIKSKKEKQEELRFLFNSGFKEINGVSRGIYLNKIAKARAMLPPGGNSNGYDSKNLLPLEVYNKGEGGENKYLVLLDNIVIHSNSPATMDVYLVVEDINEEKQKLVFNSLNKTFTPKGLVGGQGKIGLGTQIDIKLNNSIKLILPANENYISWDCEGFQTFNLSAELEICRNYITPLDTDLKPLPQDERFKVHINANFSDWLQTVIDINSETPFAVTGYEDIKWNLNDLTIDLSDTYTPSFSLPNGYSGPYANSVNLTPQWRGVYIKNLTAYLPKSWSKDTTKHISVEISEAIIDGNGFTGVIEGNDVLPFDQGSMGGWKFSVDNIQMVFVQNHIRGGGFGGYLNIPIMKDDNLEYTASIFPENHYIFSISPPPNKTKFNMFCAEVNLSNNCKVEAEYIAGKFKAKATLSGQLSVTPSLVSSKDNTGTHIDLPKVTFKDFELSTEDPYFSPGEWHVSNSIGGTYNGFGVFVKNIYPYKWTDDSDPTSGNNGNIALNIDLTLALTKDSPGVKAHGGFGIKGRRNNDGGITNWDFAGFDFRELLVEGSFPGVKKIFGYIRKYDGSNSTVTINGTQVDYGTGFRGALEVQFAKIGTSLSAVGQFGSIGEGDDKYKYFFVDALANLGMGIPLSPIPLKIQGFGGGLSYHMDRQFSYDNLDWNKDITTPPSGLGQSFSGTVYLPDSNIWLGLQATMLISATKEEAFNGSVSFGIQFIDHGGIDKIQMYGEGKFMEPISIGSIPEISLSSFKKEKPFDEAAPSGTAAIKAYFNLEIDFASGIFTGNLTAFMDAQLGSVNMHGDGGNNKLIDASLYFSKDKWHIYIGTPTKRAGIMLSALGLKAKLNAYIDIGTEIPDFPGVPANVRSVVGDININNSMRNSGAGFMFGASFNTTATLNAIVASASVEAEIGFDIMLRKYKNATCAGMSGEVGINGWYATGQMWAYLAGELKIVGITVFKAGVAAVFQAQLPNPWWLRSTFGIKYKNWRGKTKSRTVTVEIGERCIMSGSNASQLGFSIISDVQPGGDTILVKVNTAPIVYLNVPLERKSKITMGGTEKEFEAKNFTATLTTKDGYELPITIDTSNMYSRKIIPVNMLPPNDTITLKLSVDLYINGVKSNDNSETRDIVYITDGPLDYIPESNVSDAYPFNGMVNFYRNEYLKHKGFIDLNIGQTQLIYDLPEGVENYVRITSSSGEIKIEEPYTYNYGRIEYDIDPGALVPGEQYKLELIKKPVSADSGDSQPTEKIIYSMYFRVSNYENIKSKFESIVSGTSSSSGLPPYQKTGGYTILQRDVGDEPFSQAEIDKVYGFDKLIDYYIDFGNNAWFNEYKTYMYDKFPDSDIKFEGQIEEVYHSLTVESQFPSIIDEKTYINGVRFDTISQKFKYYPAWTANKDHSSLKGLIDRWYRVEYEKAEESCKKDVDVIAYPPNLDSCIDNYINLSQSIKDFKAHFETFKDLPTGDYRVYVVYTLPDGTRTTYTTIHFNYNNNN